MTSTDNTAQQDQLIEAFNQQALNLDEILAKAEQGYGDAKQIMIQLMGIPGQDVEALELAWKKVNRGRKALKLLDATLVGAKAVIVAVTEQRDAAIDELAEVSEELDDITNAIDSYDSGHSKLEDFANSMRDDGYTEGMDDGHEKARVAYNEELYDAISENEGEIEENIVGDIAGEWNLVRHVARDLLSGLRGNDSWTDEQRDAFLAFLKVYNGETDE